MISASISSHLVSSLVLLSRHSSEFASLGFPSFDPLSCLLLSSAVLTSLACTRRIIASSPAPPWLSSFSLLHQSNRTTSSNKRSPNSCTPGLLLQYSTSFSLLAASTTSWLISTSARLTSPCKRAQPYSTIDPSSELQSLSHKTKLQAANHSFPCPHFQSQEAFVFRSVKQSPRKKKT